MATVNAIAVALFNAAAGGYAAQISRDSASLANAVGLILEKDIPTDAVYVEHLLSNFGVSSSSLVYFEAKKALENLILHKIITLKNVDNEKYGRILADVYLGDIHINEWLIKERYAVR